MTDEELFVQYRLGDAQAFGMLYSRYRQSLYLYLLRSCVIQAEADDLYQETWSRAIVARQRFQEGAFRAWIFQIARNLLIDRYRRRHMQGVSAEELLDQVVDANPLPDEASHGVDCGQRLKRQLGLLPQEQRDAFLLKEESGLTLQQIAALVCVGRETIKSRLRYALKSLRQALEDCL